MPVVVPFNPLADSLEEGINQSRMLCVKATRPGVPEAEIRQRCAGVIAFLAHLEHDVRFIPANMRTLLGGLLRKMTDMQPNEARFPRTIVEAAGRVHAKYLASNWGTPVAAAAAQVVAVQTPTRGGGSRGRPRGSSQAGPGGGSRAGGAQTHQIETAPRLPAPDHEIWGVNGSMHGVYIKPAVNGSNTYALDPRYETEKREAKVFGHNGLVPGAWWPLQLLALFHGAHGTSMGGICGNAEEGAYSILISGKSKYHELDSDEGNIVLYSADSSTDNSNAKNITHISDRTKSLQKSKQNGRPVRVLRSAGGTGHTGFYTPKAGIRYDGLYRVIDDPIRMNSKGGLFIQFKLERLPNQTSLDVLRQIPNLHQRRQERSFRAGY
ncbi:PUA-like domain-containing protein [Podospora didyma]|uniref:PUA-like domain-containing protein n=1 Tax=Podospora didyma TaxID=330526 RepID=A0AAE0TZX6_9PEZI|nr:PUA-like domain-containing protein [Podospora didyma]